MDTAILIIAVAALVVGILALVTARGAVAFARRAIADDGLLRFTDVALIKAGVRPTVQHQSGTYEDPDIIVVGGHPTTPVPPFIPCPSTFVVYASRGEWVTSCQGFGGPGDGNNHVVATARGRAQRVAAQIQCKPPCDKRVEEIWKGWDCHVEAAGAFATAAVEVKVFCVLPIKP